MRTAAIIPLCIMIIAMMASQAIAAAPTWDPGYPSKYIYERALYRGDALKVPESSSSGQGMTISTTLGGDWPSRPTSTVYAGRITGYATLDSLPKNNYPSKDVLKQAAEKARQLNTNRFYDKTNPKNQEVKRGTVSKLTISGKLSRFPKTIMTPKFSGRWTGPASSALTSGE